MNGLYGLIIIACLVVMYLILYKKYNTLQKKAINRLLSAEDPDLNTQIKHMKEAGEKEVKIIKWIRKETGLGLLEAKTFFDEALKKL